MTRLERALELLGVGRPCYILADTNTGKDVCEVKDFEVEHVRHTANFSGVSRLGSRRVTLRKLTGAPMGRHDSAAEHVTLVEPRSDADDQVKLAYCCPTHGRFEVLVPRNRIPDAVECRRWTPDCDIFRGGECRALSSRESSGDPGVTSIEDVSRG